MSTRTAGPTVRALVVEDPSTTREVVRILQADGDVEVVGQASTSADAVRLARELRPDIVTLDLHLPGGGGRHAIEQIMAQMPTPILLLSSGTDDHRSTSIVDALVAGALDALPRPERWTADLGARLRHRVHVLHKVHVIRHATRAAGRAELPSQAGHRSSRGVVAVAASTGGPSALAIVLAGLGGTAVPILVVQHLHPNFTAGLVDWMTRVSPLPVQLAEHGQTASAGHVYLAPGGRHLRLGADCRLELDAAPDTIHRPSADELFTSVARQAGAAAIGVVLTGMGDDGAKGLLAIKQHGGRTLAQDEGSCAVFGMPAAARRLGAVTEMLPPAELARVIARASRQPVR